MRVELLPTKTPTTTPPPPPKLTEEMVPRTKRPRSVLEHSLRQPIFLSNYLHPQPPNLKPAAKHQNTRG